MTAVLLYVALRLMTLPQEPMGATLAPDGMTRVYELVLTRMVEHDDIYVFLVRGTWSYYKKNPSGPWVQVRPPRYL